MVLDLVTLEQRGTFPLPPLSFFHGRWGLHLVVLYLVYGDLRVPRVYRLWRGKGGKSLSLLALRLLAALPPWMRKAFVFGWWPTPPPAPSASSRGCRGWAWRRWWGCGGIGGRGRVSAS